jgi:histidyl-tRNA synthetase
MPCKQHLVAETLRNTLTKYRILTHCGGGSFKSQLKKADKTGAKLSLVVRARRN